MESADIKVVENQFRFTGVLTFDTASRLQKKAHLLMTSVEEIVFDFQEVNHCDSTALTLMMSCFRQAKQSGKKIAFVNVPQQVIEIAKVCGVEEFLPIL